MLMLMEGTLPFIGLETIHVANLLKNLEKNDLDKAIYFVWIGGYISAVNFYHSNRDNIEIKGDLDGIMLSLKNYCNKNPLGKLGEAVPYILNQLNNRLPVRR